METNNNKFLCSYILYHNHASIEMNSSVFAAVKEVSWGRKSSFTLSGKLFVYSLDNNIRFYLNFSAKLLKKEKEWGSGIRQREEGCVMGVNQIDVCRWWEQERKQTLPICLTLWFYPLIRFPCRVFGSFGIRVKQQTPNKLKEPNLSSATNFHI